MKQSELLLENAVTCARLAERATDATTQDHFKRAELAWRALANEQDWLDGEAPPVRLASCGAERQSRSSLTRSTRLTRS